MLVSSRICYNEFIHNITLLHPKYYILPKKGIYCVCLKRITCVHYNINYCNIEGVYKFIIRPQWRIKKYSMRHFINHFLSTQLIIHDLIKTRPYLHEWNFIIKNYSKFYPNCVMIRVVLSNICVRVVKLDEIYRWCTL